MKEWKRAYREFGLQAVPKNIEESNLTYTILNHYDSYLVVMVSTVSFRGQLENLSNSVFERRLACVAGVERRGRG